MAILLMFNEADELSVNEILAGTEIETENDYLFKVLSTLLKVKLLVCKNRSINEDELVSLEDTVTCNHKYKRYLSRVSLEGFCFRWLKIKKNHAAFHISIMLISKHLKSIFLVKRSDSTSLCLSNQNRNKNQMQLFKRLKTIVAFPFRYFPEFQCF